MKKSKLLFVVPSVAIATFIPLISSCSKQELDAEKIINNLFAPLEGEIQNPPEGCNNIFDAFKTLSEQEQQNELIYDLYIHYTADINFVGKTLHDLYKEKYVSAVAKINKCSSRIEDNKIYSSFQGYINFVFTKDYNDCKKGDYILITYKFSDSQAQYLSNS